MVDPTCGNNFCTEDEVEAGRDPNKRCEAKPKSVTVNGNNSWQWTIPLTDCGIDSNTRDDSGQQYYDIFLNSNLGVAEKMSIMQMGQIRFRCFVSSFLQVAGTQQVVAKEEQMAGDRKFEVNLELDDYLA